MLPLQILKQRVFGKIPIFGFDGAEISSPSAPFEFGLMGNFTIPISGRLKVEKARAGTAYESQLREVVHVEWNMQGQHFARLWTRWTAATMQVELINDVIEQLETNQCNCKHAC